MYERKLKKNNIKYEVVMIYGKIVYLKNVRKWKDYENRELEQ